MDIKDIQSLRDTVNRSYVRPDRALVPKYQEALTNHEGARNYLEKRGLKQETIQHFRLGYNEELGAISIPIFKQGNLVNIKYRFLEPKETRYTSEKGAETWVFNDTGLDLAQAKGRLLIVEGEFDCMMAWQAGVDNVISPASGKDSYGVWLEHLEKIPKVYIAYDNDHGGKETARELADRVGADKCFEVVYPVVKDANEYLLEHSEDDFKKLVNAAKPFYRQQFKGVVDIIDSIRNKKEDTLKVKFIPKVEIEKDWLIVMSGRSNVGKTTTALNIANDLAESGVPVLIMPFERGIESVGKRYLQIKFDKTIQELRDTNQEEWDKMLNEVLDNPIYFALPKKADIISTITKAKRYFNTKVVIVDHLDYIVRNSSASKESEIGQTLQELKRVAEENGVVMLIITHIRKIDQAGGLLQRKPGIEDLKGSASLYQDPECVIMLDGEEGFINVSVVKNKGEMTSQSFPFNPATGKMLDEWGGMA